MGLSQSRDREAHQSVPGDVYERTEPHRSNISGSVGRPSAFSNYESTVSFVAPGSHIWTIYNTMLKPEILLRSGTSVSAAIVTGVLALAWSSAPGLSPTKLVEEARLTGRELPSLSGKSRWGVTLDAQKLIAKLDGARDPTKPRVLPPPGRDRTADYYSDQRSYGYHVKGLSRTAFFFIFLLRIATYA